MWKSNSRTVSFTPGDGVSQRLTSEASAKAENTFVGAAARRWRTSAMVASRTIARLFGQQPIEQSDRPGPECLVTGEPPLSVPQRLPAQPEPMDSAFDGAKDKAGFFQHLQMLRDRRLG